MQKKLLIDASHQEETRIVLLNNQQVEEFDFPDIDDSDKSTVSLTKRKGSSDGNEVWFYTVKGGGHDWPGSWGNKDMSASEEIWKFFKNHLK